MSNLKSVNQDYIKDLQHNFHTCKFTRVEKSNGMFITNDINRSMDNDYKILKETQIKRILRGNCAPLVSEMVKNKLSYFSQNEQRDINKIYKRDSVQNVESDGYAIQNVGHATQLIQLPGFNILSDPVFNDLNWLLYRAKTDSHPSVKELPIIDVIIISHNHRDHMDDHSLQNLLQLYRKNKWPVPHILVPMGDKKIFENFGFLDIEEVEWYTKISFQKTFSETQTNVNFICIPADHRSGRFLFDHHTSLVTGWIISSDQERVIFKYSGDTRSLSRDNQKSVDAILWQEIINKNFNRNKNVEDIEIPDIICLEPSGPNYTRCYMDVTHQSTSYSTLLKFVEAKNLSNLSRLQLETFLEKIKTIMMHHNKFELGPDRFNEGLFVFKKLLQYINLDQESLNEELEKQKRKLILDLDKKKLKGSLSFTSQVIISTLPEHTSLLVHAKDFIIEEIKELLGTDFDKELIKKYLLKNTIFLKIGERLTHYEIANSKIQLEKIEKYNGKNK